MRRRRPWRHPWILVGEAAAGGRSPRDNSHGRLGYQFVLLLRRLAGGENTKFKAS
jgi:hypothetical protein